MIRIAQFLDETISMCRSHAMIPAQAFCSEDQAFEDFVVETKALTIGNGLLVMSSFSPAYFPCSSSLMTGLSSIA